MEILGVTRNHAGEEVGVAGGEVDLDNLGNPCQPFDGDVLLTLTNG